MKKIIIEHTFKAPIEKIWEAFTTPEILSKWWSPVGMDNHHISVDLQKGGLFRYCFIDKNKKEFWGKGIYQTISKPNYFSYLDTFSDPEGNSVAPSYFGIAGDNIIESLVEFEFSENNNITNMKLTGDNDYSETMTDDMLKGWNSMFDKLDALLQ